MIFIGDTNLVFGSVVPPLPVEVPIGCKWRIRARNDKNWAKIYLRYPHRTEEWILGVKDGKLIPTCLQGTNCNEH